MVMTSITCKQHKWKKDENGNPIPNNNGDWFCTKCNQWIGYGVESSDENKFIDWTPSEKSISKFNAIIQVLSDYQVQNLQLTLRQLYYQLVTKNIIPNIPNAYGALSRMLTNARMSGRIPWNLIVDRTRLMHKLPTFENPSDAVNRLAKSYRLNTQKGQKNHIEVWMEKDALAGVLFSITEKYDIPLVPDKGFGSATIKHEAYLRFKSALEQNQDILIFYVGDLDPSGWDMPQTLRRDFKTFLVPKVLTSQQFSDRFKLEVLALTRNQILNVYPNLFVAQTAKKTDARYPRYVAAFKNDLPLRQQTNPTAKVDDCWEVDAIPPKDLNKIVEDAILANVDTKLMNSYDKIKRVDIELLRIMSAWFESENGLKLRREVEAQV
jgi:hypothetical protein